ncbi:F-box domain, cyclin-like domain containing protein [Pseudohyphozyma bogoriensis]|nr:F-box domain, cyclin-like domain containing protein [Pseudohyphozyma bogoriensis]
MSRRSSRLSARPPPEARDSDEQADDDDDALELKDDGGAESSALDFALRDDGSDGESDEQPPTSDDEFRPNKKSKSDKKKKGKKQRAPLQALRDMPTDIFGQICTFLDLKDILHLSRVCKPYRQFLLQRSSQVIWLRARHACGLPELELPFKSEPEYASLVFDKWCMVCGKDPILNPVDPYLRMRTCSRCSAVVVWPGAAFPEQYRATCVKLVITNPAGLCLSSDASDVLKSAKKYIGISSFFTQAPTGGPTREQWTEERTELVRIRRSDGDKIRDWVLDQAEQARRRAAEARDKKCKERKAAIEDRFVKLGWDPQDFRDPSWTSHHEFLNPAKLTKRQFEAMRTELEGILSDLLAERLSQEADDREADRMDTLRANYNAWRLAETDDANRATYPPFDEFLHFPEVETLWIEDTPLTDDRLTQATPNIKTSIADFRKRILSTLLARLAYMTSLLHSIPSNSTFASFGVSKALADSSGFDNQVFAITILQRVSVQLFCKVCIISGSFPAFLEHDCVRCGQGEEELMDVLDFDYEYSLSMWAVLKAAQLPEVGTTQDDLNSLGHRFFCRRQGCERFVDVDWRNMRRHLEHAHMDRVGHFEVFEVGLRPKNTLVG